MIFFFGLGTETVASLLSLRVSHEAEETVL